MAKGSNKNKNKKKKKNNETTNVENASNNQADNATANVVEKASNNQADNATANDSETSSLQSELSKANQEIGDLKNQLIEKGNKISELEKQLQEKDDPLKAFITFDENDAIATKSYGLKVYNGWFGGQEKAIKKVSMEDSQQYEISINSSILNYHHLLPVSYVIPSGDVLYLVMEICEYNALDYLEKDLTNEINLAPLKVVKHVLKATARLHKFNIVHGNINPHSVRFKAVEKMTKNVDTHKFTTVISDFGLCRKNGVAGDSVSSLQYTKTSYSAPEIFEGQSAGRGADIFSVGVLSSQLLTGKHPFGNYPGMDHDCEEKQRQDRLSRYKLSIETTTDPFQSHLLKKMLNKNPTDRPSANELLKGPLLWDACKKMTFVSAIVDYYESIDNLSFLNCVHIGAHWKNWWNKLEPEILDFLARRPEIEYKPESGKDMLRVFRNAWAHFAIVRSIKKQKAQDLYNQMCTISPNAILRLYDDALTKEGIITFLTEKSFKLVLKQT